MAISDQDVKELYQGNGLTATFAIPFDYETSSEVKVYLRDETTTTNITETLQSSPSQYSISGSNIVMVSAPTSTQKLLIIRVNPITQTMIYNNSGPFLATDHEDSMDRMVRMIQELNEKVNRCLKAPITSSPSFDGEIDPNWAGKALVLSGDGLSFSYANVPTSLETIRTITSSGSIVPGDGTVLVNASSGDVVITMYTAVGYSMNQVSIKRIDNSGNSVTVIFTDLCDGRAYQSLDNQYQTITMKSDGVTWWLK